MKKKSFLMGVAEKIVANGIFCLMSYAVYKLASQVKPQSLND